MTGLGETLLQQTLQLSDARLGAAIGILVRAAREAAHAEDEGTLGCG